MIFFSLFPIIQYILRLKQGTGRGWQWRMCKMVLLRKEPWLQKTKPLQITNLPPPSHPPAWRDILRPGVFGLDVYIFCA